MAKAFVSALHRYPVKGLSPEPLQRASLEAGRHFPGDRLYAIENGPSGFDPANPAFRPKTKFLMLMRHERLARLRTSYDDASGVLTIHQGEVIVSTGDLGTAEGRTTIEAFMEKYCADVLKGPPRVLGPFDDFRFMDSSRSGFVSLLNLASVRDLSGHAGRDIDPLRFRTNIHVEGWTPWVEMGLVGRRLRIGHARLEVLKTIVRCPATDVDPRTGDRDTDVVSLLKNAYGHIECGVYAKIKEPGDIAPGSEIVIED